MKSRLFPVFFSLLLTFTTVLFAEDAETLSEQELAVLQSISDALETINSVEIEADFVISFEFNGMKNNTSMPVSFAFDQANKLGMMKLHQILLIADGEHFYKVSEEAKSYKKTPYETLDEISGLLGSESSIGPNELEYLMASNKLELLKKVWKEASMSYEGEEACEGKPCWKLRVGQIGLAMAMERDWHIWIDQATGLIAKAEILPPEPVDSEAKADLDSMDHEALMRNMRMSYKVTHRSVNEPISAELFTFDAPEDYKEIKRFLSGPLSNFKGLAPFELSGRQAPSFELELLDGSTFHYPEDAQGKVVFIDFWATWCSPCMMALPDVVSLAESFSDEPVLFLGISRDSLDSQTSVEEAVEEHNISYPIGIDASDEISEAFFVEGIPCIVIIGADGIVQGRQVGYSPEAESMLTDVIRRVLNGETLPSAEPLSEEELAQLEEERTREYYGASVSELDETAFTLLWEKPVKHAGETADNNSSSFRFAPRYLYWLGETDLVVMDPITKDTISLTLPETMLPDESQSMNDIEYYHLRDRANSYCIAIRTNYEQTEPNSYSSSSVDMVLFDTEGTILKEESMGDDWISEAAVFSWNDSDYLLINRHDHFQIMDAKGIIVLKQEVGYSNQCTLIQDENGDPLFYLSTEYGLKAYKLKAEALQPKTEAENATEDNTPDDSGTTTIRRRFVPAPSE